MSSTRCNRGGLFGWLRFLFGFFTIYCFTKGNKTNKTITMMNMMMMTMMEATLIIPPSSDSTRCIIPLFLFLIYVLIFDMNFFFPRNRYANVLDLWAEQQDRSLTRNDTVFLLPLVLFATRVATQNTFARIYPKWAQSKVDCY